MEDMRVKSFTTASPQLVTTVPSCTHITDYYRLNLYKKDIRMTVKNFIDRPILSGVISVLIVILGIIGLVQLPIEQFPNIAPPTVRVSATYTGANAETVMKSVIVPLEESLNGVEDMMYMTSTATNTGTASISIFFKQGTDADMAVVNVQNRVASAQGLLPARIAHSSPSPYIAQMTISMRNF